MLRVPGAALFSAAAAVARFPAPMLGVGVVLMVEAMTDSFAAAGRVSALLIGSQALATPVLARWVDRYGQRRIGGPALAVTTAGMLGLGLAGMAHAPEPLLWALAVLTGAGQGPFGGYVRARWAYVLGGDRRLRLHTSFSLEAAVDEFTYVVGPVVAALIATRWIPSGTMFVAAVAGVVGGVWFLAQRRTEPPVGQRAITATPRRGGLLATPGVGVVVVLFIGVGAVFGAADIATVASSVESGRPELAGVMLGCFALGSMVAGIAYGARVWRWSTSARFVAGALALAVGVSAFAWASTLPQLGVALAVAGLAVSPTVICGNALVQQLVPSDRLTEGLAWLGTAMMAGISLGAWVSGWRVDAVGSHGGYLVVLVIGWCCAGLAAASLRHLRAAIAARPLQGVLGELEPDAARP